MMSSGANHTLYFIAAVNLSGVKAQFQLITSSRVVTKGEQLEQAVKTSEG